MRGTGGSGLWHCRAAHQNQPSGRGQRCHGQGSGGVALLVNQDLKRIVGLVSGREMGIKAQAGRQRVCKSAIYRSRNLRCQPDVIIHTVNLNTEHINIFTPIKQWDIN